MYCIFINRKRKQEFNGRHIFCNCFISPFLLILLFSAFISCSSDCLATCTVLLNLPFLCQWKVHVHLAIKLIPCQTINDVNLTTKTNVTSTCTPCVICQMASLHTRTWLGCPLVRRVTHYLLDWGSGLTLGIVTQRTGDNTTKLLLRLFRTETKEIGATAGNCIHTKIQWSEPTILNTRIEKNIH